MSHGHSIRCHSPFKHYEMFHSSSSLDSFNNSIFGGIRVSSTYNFNYNDGGFWGGFKNGIGLGLGNLFGGLFGGFMGGIFGGFGNMFGGFGGGMGFGFPWGGGFGGGLLGGGTNNGLNDGSSVGAGSGRRSRTTSNNSDSSRVSKDSNSDGTPSASTCKDDDRRHIEDLWAEYDKVGNDPAKAQALRNKVKAAIANQKDDHQNVHDKNAYERILLTLGEKFDFDKNGKATPKASSTPLGLVANQIEDAAITGNAVGDPEAQQAAHNNGGAVQLAFPAGLTDNEKDRVNSDITALQAAGIKIATSDDINSDSSLKKATDTKIPWVIRKDNNSFTMSGKFGDTNFPLNMSITTKQGNTHNYRCISVTSSGYAIYATPETDVNNNKYILTIQNGELVLHQGNSLSGKPDTQCD